MECQFAESAIHRRFLRMKRLSPEAFFVYKFFEEVVSEGVANRDFVFAGIYGIIIR